MDYTIVTEDSPWRLESAVRKKIEQGYKPVGGIAVKKAGWFDDYDEYSQAMSRSTK